MNNARYTFLHYIADNVSIPVHYVHRDPTDPQSDVLAMNAINVEVLSVQPGVAVSMMHVAIDVINDDETTAVDWTTTLWGVLSASFMTPLLNYSNPTSPVALGGNITWSDKNLSFKHVSSDLYFRMSLTLAVSFPEL